MDVIMPKMGESVNEGTLIKWHKKVGDFVKRDEIIFEISTDKVDTEIPAAEPGIISEILVPEGETVEVGTIVARITTTDSLVNDSKEDLIENKNVFENNKTVNSEDENVIEITMPKMGESVMEGTIIKWYKKVGDVVKKDETIFEISTDKVDTEIPAPENGILKEILVGEQETVEVGTIVARISTDAKVTIRKKETIVEKDRVGENKIESMHDNFSRISETHSFSSINSGFYSPLVLNIAQKENISLEDLKSIKGTGLDNRVTKKDILSFVETKKSENSANKNNLSANSNALLQNKSEEINHFEKNIFSTTEVEKIPMDNVRQRIKEHMIISRDTSVHVTELMEVDMTKIHNFIEMRKEEILEKEKVKLTYMAFIADAAIKALKKYPLVNSSIEGDTILQKKFINLGIAVAVEPTGLIVPNIKNAGDKNIIGLARSITELATKARTKKLIPDDIMNGTFSITNYGVFGTIFGTPIINQPEVAILGVGAVQKKPIVIELDGSDTIAIRKIMSLTLSHDHRLIDGMLGAMFLKSIKETLENFEPENSFNFTY